MNTETLRRQYDEVVAENYDFDPQGVIAGSFDRAEAQLRAADVIPDDDAVVPVLDLGMGTGLFLARLAARYGDRVAAFGLDLSEKMIDRARRRVPGLTAEVADAADLDVHFPGQPFDLACTHFMTGFVPMRVLAPKIHARLSDGGYWSFVGGTMAGYPALRAKSDTWATRMIGGTGGTPVKTHNPADRDEVVRTLEEHGFVVRACEVHEPPLDFPDFDTFMEFAYQGSWLTPFVEAYGLHKAGWLTKFLLNRVFFPIQDRHHVVVALAQKA